MLLASESNYYLKLTSNIQHCQFTCRFKNGTEMSVLAIRSADIPVYLLHDSKVGSLQCMPNVYTGF